MTKINENTAEIKIELDLNGKVNAVLEGTQGNLLTMLTHCIGQVLQANYCSEVQYELEKLELVKAILSLEVVVND